MAEEKVIILRDANEIVGSNADEISDANKQVLDMVNNTVKAKEELDHLESNLTRLKNANSAYRAVAKRCRTLMEEIGPRL